MTSSPIPPAAYDLPGVHVVADRLTDPLTVRLRERGFALAGSIFVLVVLSALAAYIVTLSGVAHDTVRLSVQGERARFAARGGLEWAIADIVNNAAGDLSCGSGPVSFSVAEGALTGFAVAVDCTATGIIEGSNSYTLYALVSTASIGTFGSSSYASRELIATVAF